MKFDRYKILSWNQWGVVVFVGTDYDDEKMFCINEPCYVILMQWGKISSTCLFKMHVKDMLIHGSSAICPAHQNMRL